MPRTNNLLQLSREQLAIEQVGRTSVRRRTAVVLVAQFLFVLGMVLLVEVLSDLTYFLGTERLGEQRSRNTNAVRLPPREDSLEVLFPLMSEIVSLNHSLIAELRRLEDHADEEIFLFGRQLRSPTQYLLTSLGSGNEQVYVGRGGWLFYRPGLEYLTGRGLLNWNEIDGLGYSRDKLDNGSQANPHLAILHLKAQLDRRGITLVILPTPVKLALHPEHFARAFEGQTDLLEPSLYRAFIAQLESEGVLVFDPTPALLELKRQTGMSYLMTDTHWRPEAVELVASRLGDFIRRHVDLSISSPGSLVSRQLKVKNQGDLARMLDLPALHKLYPKEQVTLQQIRTIDHEHWRPSELADILLLGDSFSNIYSLAAMGWGESAGLAEQLSFIMQRPVDRIVQNAEGAFATRELLSRELARGNDRLANKRLVIFQFSELELLVGKWKLININLRSEAGSGYFFVPDTGEVVFVSGTIQEIAPIPRPGTVPYADHITAVHLVDLSSTRVGVNGQQAIIYIWSMRDHVLQEAAHFRPGDTISIRLRRWLDVSDQYDGINRAESSNIKLQLEEPNWGEVVN